MDFETIERLHNSGKMPNWIYYQVNGKSAQANYAEQFFKILKEYGVDRSIEIYKAKRKAEIEAELEKQIEEKAVPEIEKALDKLLADWK